jgi:hypothetical protein
MAVVRHPAHPTRGTTTGHVGTGDSPVQPSASSAAVFATASRRRDDQLRQPKRRKPLNDLYGFQTHGNDLADKTNDVLRIIRPVGIIRDAATLVSGHLILVNDPFKSRPVSKPIFESLRWNTTKRQKLVVNDRSLAPCSGAFSNPAHVGTGDSPVQPSASPAATSDSGRNDLVKVFL